MKGAKLMLKDRKLGEECGVFAIYDPEGDCARSTYYGLYALQHRGQESCGIAVNNDRNITHYKDMGLVSDVFNEEILTKLDGKMAVGHVRYSTTGESMRENAQPLVLRYIKGNIAIAHNGNLVNKDELARELSVTGAIYAGVEKGACLYGRYFSDYNRYRNDSLYNCKGAVKFGKC